MRERKSVVKVTAQRYRKAGKKEKKTILDELIHSTGYNRGYASWLLRNHGRVKLAGSAVKLNSDNNKPNRHDRRKYGEAELNALKKVW